jgi:hypothetical protein
VRVGGEETVAFDTTPEGFELQKGMLKIVHDRGLIHGQDVSHCLRLAQYVY